MKHLLVAISFCTVLGSCTMPADNPTNSSESPENTGASTPKVDTSAYSTGPTNSRTGGIDTSSPADVMPQR